MIKVCSVCGADAATDSRGGSIDHFLMCGCDKEGRWINDGRGGYWEPFNNARPLTFEEYSAAREKLNKLRGE